MKYTEENFRIANDYKIKDGIVYMTAVKKVIVDGKFEYMNLPEVFKFDEKYLSIVAQAKSLTISRSYARLNGLPKHLRKGMRKRHQSSACLYLHNIVLGTQTPDGLHTSHEDGSSLNCLESNLKFRTTSENSRNRKNPKNRTGYSFVAIQKPGKYKIGIPVYVDGAKTRRKVVVRDFKSAKTAALYADGIQFLLGVDLQISYNFWGQKISDKVLNVCREYIKSNVR